MPLSSIRGSSMGAEKSDAPASFAFRDGVDAMLENLPGMAYRCRNDARCTVLFVSSGCVELLGFAPDKFVGPGAVEYEELVHPEDRAAVRGRIEAALATGRGYEVRYRVRTAAGGEKWVLDRGRGVPAAGGGLDTIVGFVSDITELKFTETKLHEQNEMLSLAFSNARDMMMLARVEPGPLFRVQNVNRRYIDVLRAAGLSVSSEELLGLTFSELRARFGFPDAAWEGIMKRYRTVVETRRPLHYDEVTETPNGTFYGQSTIAPMLDEAGACRFVLYTSNDVTERRRIELAARDSEEKFAKAFRAVPDAVFITELKSGRVVDVNGGCERIYGYTRAECIGRTTHELNIWFDVEDRRRLLAALSQSGGVVRELELPGLRRDGRKVDVSVSCETIELNGQPHLVTIAHDITDQKRAQAALRESEERFSTAFRASPGAMAINDGETKRFVEVNEGFCRILGLTRDELIGRTGAEAGMWQDQNDRRRFYEALQAKGMIRDLEIVARHRDGHGIACLLSTQMVQLGGRPHLITALQDITEQKRAQAALRESEERFSTAFRSSPGAIGIVEMESRRFVEVNEGFCALVGYGRQELIGHTAFELGLWKEERDRQRFLDLILSEGAVRDLEMTVRRKDGRLITCLLGARIIELAGRQNLITALHDITERKAAEETRLALEGQLRQAQKLDALGQLAGGIAHDFNNILTGIIAYSELAVMDVNRPDEVKRHLATVRRAADRATQLARQILTFSRKNAKEREPMVLGPVVREALKLLQSSLPKMLTIDEQIGSTLPVVLADATQVHQIVMNLCTNAAHAMRRGPGRLTVSLDRVEWLEGATAAPPGLEPGVYARLRVADTGEGMSEEVLAKIFEPFFTTKPQGEGTGLGLSVVHGIVEDHDGLITVRSRLGEGTTFEVHFPEYDAPSGKALAEGSASPLGTGQRVLFIDDEVVIAGAAALILQRFGYKVTAQSDPRAALGLFEAAPDAFDVVVTDLTMPQVDGIEVARRILEKRPGLPILLATGHSGGWTLEKLRALGIRGLLMKPLNADKLRKSLGEVLGARR